jgi:hypothetical protein
MGCERTATGAAAQAAATGTVPALTEHARAKTVSRVRPATSPSALESRNAAAKESATEPTESAPANRASPGAIAGSKRAQ